MSTLEENIEIEFPNHFFGKGFFYYLCPVIIFSIIA